MSTEAMPTETLPALSDTETPSEAPQGQYLPPEPQRPRNLLVGASLSSAMVVMYFGALVGIYLSERASFLNDPENTSWIPSGVDIQLAAPSVILWTLFFSVVTIQWAIYSTNRNDRRHTLIALSVTAVFGIAVINQLFFIFNQMGFEIDSGTLAAPLVYTLLGSFMASMVAALIFLLVAALRTLSGDSTRPNSQLVTSAAIFWDSLVFIYFVLWVVIFVTK